MPKPTRQHRPRVGHGGTHRLRTEGRLRARGVLVAVVLTTGCTLQDFAYLHKDNVDRGVEDAADASQRAADAAVVDGSVGSVVSSRLPTPGGAEGSGAIGPSPTPRDAAGGGDLPTPEARGGSSAKSTGDLVEAGTGGAALGGSPNGGAGGRSGRIGYGGLGGKAGRMGDGGAGGRSTASTARGGAGGSAELDSGAEPCVLCLLRAALVHRYRFDDTGTLVKDSIGSADGTVVNAQMSGSGSLVLDGNSSEQYVNLPNGVLSSLASATLEVWVTWNGGDNYQRIFDLGDNSAGEDARGAGRTYVTLSPNYPLTGAPRIRASYRSAATVNTISVNASAPLATGAMSHLAVALDEEAHAVRLYLNGALLGEQTGLRPLSEIADLNNWLGRSQYAEDPQFLGAFHEFRIYAIALTATQVQASYSAGPDSSLDR